jgi:hypothetical protein
MYTVHSTVRYRHTSWIVLQVPGKLLWQFVAGYVTKFIISTFTCNKVYLLQCLSVTNLITKFTSNKIYNNKIYIEHVMYKLCHTSW